MLPVIQQPEPKNFDSKVRQPGWKALNELITGQKREGRGRPRKQTQTGGYGSLEKIPAKKLQSQRMAYWQNCIPELRSAYKNVCAYSGLRIHTTNIAEVDHFWPKSNLIYRHLLYEWSNYRLSLRMINSKKGEHVGIVDPFESINGWFELELIGFQVILGNSLPPTDKLRAENTIKILGLNCDDLCKYRAEAAERYWEDPTPKNLKHLTIEAPFVAHELQRQNRLQG